MDSGEPRRLRPAPAAILDSAALAVGRGACWCTPPAPSPRRRTRARWGLSYSATRSLPWSPSPSPSAGRPWGCPPCASTPWTGARATLWPNSAGWGRTPAGPGAFTPQIPKQERALAQDLYQELCPGPVPEGMALVGGRVLLTPPGPAGALRPGVLRAGVELAEVRGKRLEPCHAFYEPPSGGAAPVPGPLPPGPPAGRLPPGGGDRL